MISLVVRTVGVFLTLFFVLSIVAIWVFNSIASKINFLLNNVIDNPELMNLISFLIYVVINLVFTAPVIYGLFVLSLMIIIFINK